MDRPVIVDEGTFDFLHTIRPSHIDTNASFADAFGNYESESNAILIVRMSQSEDTWVPLSRQSIEKYLRSHQNKPYFDFSGLVEKNWLLRDRNGYYLITHRFVCQCFLVAPKLSLFKSKR